MGVEKWGPMQAAEILSQGQYMLSAESVAAVRLMVIEWLNGVQPGEWGKGSGAKGRRGTDNDDNTRKRMFYSTVRLIKKQRDDFVQAHCKDNLLFNIIESGITSDPLEELSEKQLAEFVLLDSSSGQTSTRATSTRGVNDSGLPHATPRTSPSSTRKPSDRALPLARACGRVRKGA